MQVLRRGQPSVQQGSTQLGRAQIGHLLEEGCPVRRVIQPDLPAGLDLLLEVLGEVPEGDRTGRMVDLLTALGGDGEHRPGLGEVRSRPLLAQARSVFAVAAQ